jgi:hypothetical protein
MAREDGFFDDLARGLADGSLTRGKALRLMGAALVGGALGSVGIGEASADPPGCKRNGKNCVRNEQCCSGNCSGGSCQAQTTTTTTTTPTTSTSTSTTSTTPGCLPNGTNCDFDQQCCGEVCNGGICCSGPHGGCDTDDDCCTGFCILNACEPCRPDGDPCTLDGECCNGTCLSGTCTDCMPDESQCTTDTECCNGNCFQGSCVPRNRIQCGCENGAAGACTSTDCSDATAVNQLCTDLCAQLGQGAVPELSECIPEGCVS